MYVGNGNGTSSIMIAPCQALPAFWPNVLFLCELVIGTMAALGREHRCADAFSGMSRNVGSQKIINTQYQVITQRHCENVRLLPYSLLRLAAARYSISATLESFGCSLVPQLFPLRPTRALAAGPCEAQSKRRTHSCTLLGCHGSLLEVPLFAGLPRQ